MQTSANKSNTELKKAIYRLGGGIPVSTACPLSLLFFQQLALQIQTI